MASAPTDTTATHAWDAQRATRPALHQAAERLGDIEALDPLAERMGELARRLTGASPAVKDALSGTWLGHALHPLLTDVPIGTWTSATLLDLIGGDDRGRGAERLIAVGIVAAVPTAASGYSDWADSTKLDDTIKRGGLVHAMANVTALALYTASLAARWGGQRRRGVLLGLVGAGAMGVGGHLGGHLSFAKGLGVDQTAFSRQPSDWTKAMDASDLPEGTTSGVEVDGHPVLLSQRDGRITAISGRCTHRGGPLADGEISDDCVTCPWHGSRFRLGDGSVQQGPAAFPQPAYHVRVRDGALEVKAAE